MGRRRDRTHRGTTKSLCDLPTEIQAVIRQIQGFTDVGIFGSYFRGDWVDGESDLDLAIKDCDTWIAVIRSISKYRGIHIDVRELFDNEQILILEGAA